MTPLNLNSMVKMISDVAHGMVWAGLISGRKRLRMWVTIENRVVVSPRYIELLTRLIGEEAMLKSGHKVSKVMEHHDRRWRTSWLSQTRFMSWFAFIVLFLLFFFGSDALLLVILFLFLFYFKNSRKSNETHLSLP